MCVLAQFRIAAEDTEQLDAQHRIVAAQVAGHQAEETWQPGRPHYGTQRLVTVAAAQPGQSLAHERNALGNRQQVGDVIVAKNENLHPLDTSRAAQRTEAERRHGPVEAARSAVPRSSP